MSTLTTYVFSKRQNSTLQPTPGTDVDIVLKNGANITSPVFTISSAGEPAFNYCKFGTRYYFVRNKNNIRNGLWEVECDEDYLASWKTDIGNTIALILYATGGRDDIMDKRIPLKDTINISKSSTVNTPFVIGRSETYIAGITGTGSLGMYMFYSANDISGMLDGVDTWGGGLANLDDVFKQLIYGGGASDNLKSVITLPILIGLADVNGTAEAIHLGNYPAGNGVTPIMGIRVNRPIVDWSDIAVNINWHYTDWRKNDSYTSVYIHVPLVGIVNLPFNAVRESDKVYVHYSLCVTTGDLSVYIKNGFGVLIATASTNIAGLQAFGNSGYNGMGVTASAIAGLGGIVGGALTGNLLGIGAGLASITGGVLANMSGDASGSPVTSGTTLAGQDTSLWTLTINRLTANDPSHYNSLIGKPVMGVGTISSYSGYVQTDGAQVAGAMLKEEREAINSALDGGIYYE